MLRCRRRYWKSSFSRKPPCGCSMEASLIFDALFESPGETDSALHCTASHPRAWCPRLIRGMRSIPVGRTLLQCTALRLPHQHTLYSTNGEKDVAVRRNCLLGGPRNLGEERIDQGSRLSPPNRVC